MIFVKDAQKHISVFISHCAENNGEAQRWERTLSKAGFGVQQYGKALPPGQKLDTVDGQIRNCNFFLFLVSDLSKQSHWVQRELGLALDVQRKNRGYRPLIIPIYTKGAASPSPSDTFPTRDFYSGEVREDYPLGEVRGLDIHRQPVADSDDVLISLMKPSLLVSRMHFSDESTFFETDVLGLYKELFSEVERDSTEDILQWVLHSDIGEAKSRSLRDGTHITYNLDSRFFILTLASRAIGFAFVTYDKTSKIMYANYMAVHECWRSGDVARAFAQKIEEVLRRLFPEYRGTVFEVQKLDKVKVEQIVANLEATGSKVLSSKQDRDEIRRFLRVSLYQHRGCMFFLNRSIAEPLICRSPCLEPSLPSVEWESQEEDYWLMWYHRPDAPLEQANVFDAWNDAVKCIRIEILAKSLVHAHPQFAEQYWPYANAVVDRTLRQTEVEAHEACLGTFLDRHSDLRARWERLKIPISI